MIPYKFTKSNSALLKYILSISIGISILVGVATGEIQYQSIKSQLIQQEKENMMQVLSDRMTERVNKLKMFGESYKAFFESTK